MKKIILLLLFQLMLAMPLAGQVSTFGIFTDNTAVDDSITVGLDADVYVWDETLTDGTISPFEGDSVMTFQTVAAGWFGGGIASFDPVDLSGFADGYLNFMVKMPSNVTFKIGIIDTLDNQSYVEFPAGQTIFNLERNGEWDQAVIPVSRFSGVDLTIMSYEFVFLEENGTECEFAIDDIYYSLDADVDPYVEFDGESYATDDNYAQITVYDEIRANSLVSVMVSNGPGAVNVDVTLDATGLGTGTVYFGATNDATDTIAIFENGLITVTYLDNAGTSRTDNAEITPPVPDYTFGLFTEETPVDDGLTVGVDSEIYVWEGTLVAGTIPPYEGSLLMTFQTVDKGWFGGGIESFDPLDLSVFEKGYLNFMIKIPAEVTFKIGIIDQTNENWIQFNAGQTMYGLERNGDWGKVMIPMQDLRGNVDLSTIKYSFAFLEEGGTECEFGIDDVYYSLDPSVILNQRTYTILDTSATIEIEDVNAGSGTVPVAVLSGTESISIDVVLDSNGRGSSVLNFGATDDASDTIMITEGDTLTVEYIDNSGNLRTDTALIYGAPSEKYIGIYSESHFNPILEYSGIINSADWEGDNAEPNEVSTAVTPVDGIFVLEVLFEYINANWAGIAFDYENLGYDISKYDTFVFNVNKTQMPMMAMMWVKIEDHAGNFFEVNIADLTPEITGDWNKYEIPLSLYTGVDMTDLKYILIVNPKSFTNTPQYGTLYFDDIHLYDSTVAIEESGTIEKFSLMQNYPNPFNPSTVIKFNIDRTAMVKLDVFDVNGQLVTTLVNQKMNKGGYSVNWNASGMNGKSLSSGVYFYRLSIDGKAAVTKNMILVK